MKKSYRDTIIAILKTLSDHGPMYGTQSPSTQILMNMNLTLDDKEVRLFSRLLDSLVAEGYLLPAINTATGRPSLGRAAGITVKGLIWLDSLEHPRKQWLKKNWFALSVAAITLLVSIAGIAVEFK